VELTPVAVACRRVVVLDPYALVMSLGVASVPFVVALALFVGRSLNVLVLGQFVKELGKQHNPCSQ